MTTLRKLILGAASLAALAAATGASAQSTATATGTASVTIIAPITLTKTVDMAFGKVVPSGTAGTVILSAASSTSATPSNVTLLTSAKTAAKFTVGGTGGQTYAVSLPGSAVEIGGSGTGLTLDTFTSSWTSGDTITSAPDLYVGGTLHVPATVAAGTYTGTFNVSVNYN